MKGFSLSLALNLLTMLSCWLICACVHRLFVQYVNDKGFTFDWHCSINLVQSNLHVFLSLCEALISNHLSMYLAMAVDRLLDSVLSLAPCQLLLPHVRQLPPMLTREHSQ